MLVGKTQIFQHLNPTILDLYFWFESLFWIDIETDSNLFFQVFRLAHFFLWICTNCWQFESGFESNDVEFVFVIQITFSKMHWICHLNFFSRVFKFVIWFLILWCHQINSPNNPILMIFTLRWDFYNSGFLKFCFCRLFMNRLETFF